MLIENNKIIGDLWIFTQEDEYLGGWHLPSNVPQYDTIKTLIDLPWLKLLAHRDQRFTRSEW